MADISVQVSSAGLTAYGAGTWSSQSFGGDQSASIAIGSVDAFNTEGWGAYQWGYLVWGQSFENATVQVITPGTPTTWGQSTYGNYSWNQITGTQSEIGEESIEAGANVTLSTNVLTLVNSSVSAEIAFAITLSTNVLNTTVANVFVMDSIRSKKFQFWICKSRNKNNRLVASPSQPRQPRTYPYKKLTII